MLEDHKGSSLIIKNVESFQVEDELEIPLQVHMEKYTRGTGGIAKPTTKIKFKEKVGNSIIYEVEQYSETIKETIRFYLDGLKEFNHGYQKKAIFPLIYRKSDIKVFVFTNIFHGRIFFTRLSELKKKIVLKNTYFDFEDFKLIPEIKNIWGVWEDVALPHKKTNASFGNQVDKSVDVQLSRATSINLKMEIDGKVYTLTVSKDGRISSPQRLKKEELISIFDRYFKKYLKTET